MRIKTPLRQVVQIIITTRILRIREIYQLVVLEIQKPEVIVVQRIQQTPNLGSIKQDRTGY